MKSDCQRPGGVGSSGGKKLRKGHLICQLNEQNKQTRPSQSKHTESWHKTVWCTLCQTIKACPGDPCRSISSLMESRICVSESRLITRWQVSRRSNKAGVSFSSDFIYLAFKRLSLVLIWPCLQIGIALHLLNFSADRSDPFKRLNLEHVEDTTLYSWKHHGCIPKALE